MFTQPIKYTRLKSMQEVLNFSYRTNSSATPLTKCQNNGQIAFTDHHGFVYVTPYRPEIHDILQESGYKDGSLFVPFSNGEKRPLEYQWLAKIAEEECWAKTHEEAYNVASNKGIQPVKANGKYQIKEILTFYDTDTDSYLPLTMKFLLNESEDNIGTYILVDEKTIVICDEYGRTFLVKAKTAVNDLVNTLIDSGYTRTVHPARYVIHKPKQPEVTTEE